MATLTTGMLQGLASNPDVPPGLAAAAEVELSAGVPFLSDAELDDALAASGLDDFFARFATFVQSFHREAILRIASAASDGVT